MNMLNVLLIIGAVFIAGCPLIGCIGGFLRLRSKKYNGDAADYYTMTVAFSFVLGIVSLIMAMVYRDYGAIIFCIVAAIATIMITTLALHHFFEKKERQKLLKRRQKAIILQ